MPTTSEPRNVKGTELSPRLTLCLAMDLKGSTMAGMKLITRRLDRFNLALVNQLTPHLKTVGLEDALIKFTGDGWLIMSDDPDHAAPLCCLAMIMSRKFQLDMAKQASLSPQNVPSMRLAICWARDLPVELPNGQRDFVGDSARHAVRACQLCRDNEVVIDETVFRWVHRDFVTSRINVRERLKENPSAKMEEELALHVLEELKVESAADADAPVYFVNTLAIIGRSGEAKALASRIAGHLQHKAEEPGVDQTELLQRFNRLLASSVDQEDASRILHDMREAGLRPNVDTLNALIAKAEDYEAVQIWLQHMEQDGIQPNLSTFKTLIEKARDEITLDKWVDKMRRAKLQPDTATLSLLISKAKDHATAVTWLEHMEEEGVKPNAETFDLLIEKAEDVVTAKAWIEKMFKAGIQPGLFSFLTLFSKDITSISAEELLRWYLSLEYHPPEAMQRAIAAYRRKGRLQDALRLALDYPYNQSSLKLVREYPSETLAYFQSVVNQKPDHPNGAYALGMALMELGQYAEAEPWLARAHDLAAPGPRKEELNRFLTAVRQKTSMVAQPSLKQTAPS